MKQKPRVQQQNDAPASAETAEKEISRQGSRYSSGSDDLNLSNVSQSQPGRAPFPPPQTSSNNNNQASLGVSGGDPHDDSGIGIRTPEEDFPMDKFAFSGAENVGLSAGELTAGAG
jgi:regulatory factor X